MCPYMFPLLEFQRLYSDIENASSSRPYYAGFADPYPDPNWIRIQSVQWIRIRIRDPDPEGQK
jgi:hypothetical protein